MRKERERGRGRRDEDKDGEKGWTRASNERLSLALADTDALQATFSGFSFPLDARNRGRERREKDGDGRGEKEKQDEGERRNAKAASCFRWGMSQFSLSEKDEGRRLLQRHVPRAHEALTPGIYLLEVETRLYAKHRRWVCGYLRVKSEFPL